MSDKNVISLESEIGFRALFQYATVGIVVVGQTGNLELINPHAEMLFGYSNAELIGKPIETLIPENLHGRHHHHRDAYFEKPKSRPMGQGMDLYARRKDGSVFPVEISLSYYELADEKLAMAFISDISKRKESENLLKRANEELEEKVRERTMELTAALGREKDMNEMKSRFVSMASHEFRTPLSAVLSSVSLIEKYAAPENEEKRTKHIDRIKSSVRNLTDILNDFLSLDKLEEGKVDVDSEAFNLNEFLEDCVEEMDGMLKKKEQHIAFSYTGSTEIVQDKKILRNIMHNLLSNAIKYSPEEKKILLTAEVDDTGVTIKVKDEGIGIPVEEQKHLFNKFYRAKNAVNIQGTGLGLNIVKKYIELLNGEISFTSMPEAGTTFIIEFPKNNK